MVILKNSARTSSLAKAYIELVSHVVKDVTVDDYKAFTTYLEGTDKDIVLSPPNFISVLTGIKPVQSVEDFLKFETLEEKLSKRDALIVAH